EPARQWPWGLVRSALKSIDCSDYDCEFIALAMMLETHVVTLVKKLLRSFPKYALALTAQRCSENRPYWDSTR
ncbi:MAG: hypothetical protein KKA36_03700, partial [Gammaproteobacteria bacterium]|nr:hypothetical protein [Gammaproteobacteria bacterium]